MLSPQRGFRADGISNASYRWRGVFDGATADGLKAPGRSWAAPRCALQSLLPVRTSSRSTSARPVSLASNGRRGVRAGYAASLATHALPLSVPIDSLRSSIDPRESFGFAQSRPAPRPHLHPAHTPPQPIALLAFGCAVCSRLRRRRSHGSEGPPVPRYSSLARCLLRAARICSRRSASARQPLRLWEIPKRYQSEIIYIPIQHHRSLCKWIPGSPSVVVQVDIIAWCKVDSTAFDRQTVRASEPSNPLAAICRYEHTYGGRAGGW